MGMATNFLRGIKVANTIKSHIMSHIFINELIIRSIYNAIIIIDGSIFYGD